MPSYKKREFTIGEYWLDKRQGSPAYYRCWYDPNAKRTCRVSLRTANIEEAEQRLRDWYVEQFRPREAEAEKTPLAVVIATYYKDHAQHQPSAEAARIALAYWNDFFTGKVVAEITPDQQSAFVRSLLARGHSENYIKRTLQIGRAALNRAKKWQQIRSAPFILINDLLSNPNLGAAPAKPSRAINVEELAALFDAASTDRLFNLMMVMANTLCRPDAAYDLTKFRCDFDAGLVRLNPDGRHQTKKFRPTVPVTNTLRPYLINATGPHIITWPQNRKNNSKRAGRKISSLKKAFTEAVNMAGLDGKVTPYSIRRGMATLLRTRGISEWELQGWLGHRRPGSTEGYAQFAPNYMMEGRHLIDEIMADVDSAAKRQIIMPVENTLRASYAPVTKIEILAERVK